MPRFARTGADTTERADRGGDIKLVVHQYLEPAMSGLAEAADAEDFDAVRAYAYEIVVVAGTVVAACPRPRYAR